MTVVVDNKSRVVLPGAKPGVTYELKDRGFVKMLTLAKPAKPRFSKGRLMLDNQTGLLVWSGDLGEEPSDAVIRNRATD